ncbi:serine/threonine-protein kinase ULK4-like, partial [Denticeps clupeoides]|uniref:serine/threonine-protein kinase ULK4-like n=1 Tax=Denticeps clupeoides TaxID=299321 RepID=UPI0010A2F845
TDLDLAITPIMDNPKIMKTNPVQFDSKTLCVPAYSADRLVCLSPDEWEAYLQQVMLALELPDKRGPAPRAKLNLLSYLCCCITSSNCQLATRLIHSPLFPLLTLLLRSAPNWDVQLSAAHCVEGRRRRTLEDSRFLTSCLALTHVALCGFGVLGYTVLPPGLQMNSFWRSEALLTTLIFELQPRHCPSSRSQIALLLTLLAGPALEWAVARLNSPSSASITYSEFVEELRNAFCHPDDPSLLFVVEVDASEALCWITHHSVGAFQSVLEKVGLPALLGCLAPAVCRVQLNMLTMFAALLASGLPSQRLLQDRDFVVAVVRCLDSPSAPIRAKAFLLLLQIIRKSRDTLLLCCNSRLVMYIERDVRRATPGREQGGSEYLSKCLGLFIHHIAQDLPAVLDDVLSALDSIVGRKNLSAAQARQLKHNLSMMPVVLHLLTSQVFRTQVVTDHFLLKFGALLTHVARADSSETCLVSAVGLSPAEEFIRSTLSTVETMTQHPTLLTPHFHTHLCLVNDDDDDDEDDDGPSALQ